MPGAGERAYVYARSCGMTGKSFTGKNTALLRGLTRLSELDRLVFPRGSRDLPEKELLRDLEGRIAGRSVEHILIILGSFRKPPELLIRLLRAYEYADLKSVLNALAGGERRAPAFTGLGPFGTVDFAAWPDLPAMLRGTEFDFLLKKKPLLNRESKVPTPEESILLETELDRYYYASLWKALYALPPRDRRWGEKILAEEVSLRNVLWALRLRSYYGFPAAEVRGQLLDGGEGRFRGRGRGLPLPAAAADASLEFALDNRQDWEGWGREKLLNPVNPGSPWRADPRYFQSAAAEYLYRLARRGLHRNPASLDTVFCFIKLKQFEEDILTSVAEGLGLGMRGEDVFSLLEAEA